MDFENELYEKMTKEEILEAVSEEETEDPLTDVEWEIYTNETATEILKKCNNAIVEKKKRATFNVDKIMMLAELVMQDTSEKLRLLDNPEE